MRETFATEPHALHTLVVDRIKRRALRALHRTERGEAFLLETYLWGEESAESAVLDAALDGEQEVWLRRQLEHHSRDEERHARLLRERLTALGHPPTSGEGFDRLGRAKLARLGALVDAWTPRFERGRIVPVLAVAWRMETMAVRVFSRHVDVLERSGHTGSTHALLVQLLREERGHAARCERALERLTQGDEAPALRDLVSEIDAVDRSFGVSGAVGLWAVGVGLQLQGLVLKVTRRLAA